MKFKLGGSWVTLQREPGLRRSLISLRSMMKEILKKEKEGMLVELNEENVEKKRRNRGRTDSSSDKRLTPKV